MTTEEFLNICGILVEKQEDGFDFVRWGVITRHPLNQEIFAFLDRQTSYPAGAYAHDVASFFRQKLKGIETPVCSD